MNRTTLHHAARLTAALALGAGLGSAGSGLDRSLAAAPTLFGFYFEADRCEDTYGSAPTGEWFPISSYRSSTSSGFGTCIFPFEADSYVRWVAPANGTMRAYACSGGDISPDWVLQASHGCGADSSSLACGYQSPSEELPGQCYGGAGISIEVEAGTAYYLRVAGAFQEIPADYGLSMLIEFEERHSILGDLNFDGRVNGLDLGLLFANWTG